MPRFYFISKSFFAYYYLSRFTDPISKRSLKNYIFDSRAKYHC